MDLPERVCFLFGQEGPGLSEGARDACDGTFSIAQFGSTRSINASAAGAIAMHTWIRKYADLSADDAWRGYGTAEVRPDHRSGPGVKRGVDSASAVLTDPRVMTRVGATTQDLSRSLHMPIATPEKYAEMLDAAKSQGFAFPAINCTSSQTVLAALQGFADAGSDGIIQLSVGGAEFLSGPSIKNQITGSLAFAAFTTEVAKNFPVNIALHTDHCAKEKLDPWLRPLIDISVDRVARGEQPLFQSHMWDGSAVPMDENLQISEELLEKCNKANIVLEVEIGVVGGEEDGVVAEIDEKLYTTPEDALATVEALGSGENGRYMTALTFGNVHGVYKPGNVSLRPEILKEAQDAVSKKLGLPEGSKPFDLVFHGGSGSTAEEIAAAVSYGVIKMNIDTDTQYAFSRPVAGFMFENYEGVLKIDGEVGNKKLYDPRAWSKAGMAGMAARIVEACENLNAVGKSIG